jgi:hypothetical protein
MKFTRVIVKCLPVRPRALGTKVIFEDVYQLMCTQQCRFSMRIFFNPEILGIDLTSKGDINQYVHGTMFCTKDNAKCNVDTVKDLMSTSVCVP